MCHLNTPTRTHPCTGWEQTTPDANQSPVKVIPTFNDVRCEQPTLIDAQRLQDNACYTSSCIMPCHVGTDCARVMWTDLKWCEQDPLPCHTTSTISQLHKLSFKFTSCRLAWCQPAVLTLHMMSTPCHTTPFPCQALSTDSTVTPPFSPTPLPAHALHCSWTKPAGIENRQRCNTIPFHTLRPSPTPFAPILGYLGNSFKRVSYSWILSPAAQVNDTINPICS